MTEYIILRQDTEVDPGPWYVHTPSVRASSPRQAISRIKIDEKNGGHFVAIPTRSWKPLTAIVTRPVKVTIT